jgi:hypothetical protein
MKAWLRQALEFAAVLLVLPQLFVFFYHFRYLFVGGNSLGLAKHLSLYALTISWVSAPYLVALTVAVKALIRVRVPWWVTFFAAAAGGAAWVFAWNHLVYARAFSYAWSALPVLLCSLLTAGYAGARAIYLDSLIPIKPQAPAAEADGAS